MSDEPKKRSRAWIGAGLAVGSARAGPQNENRLTYIRPVPNCADELSKSDFCGQRYCHAAINKTHCNHRSHACRDNSDYP
jgi:hypothetical protein